MPEGEPSPVADRVATGGDVHSLVVLQSFPEPRPTTNPYLVQLRRHLDATPGVRVVTFSWARAILSRYDVFHVHWPEILLSGRTPARGIARRLAARVLIARLCLTRTPVVRTVHNLGRPDHLSRVENRILDALDRRTTLDIRLTSTTPERGPESVVIPHAHYRDWFRDRPHEAPVAGTIGFVGLLRPYKGIERLLEVFRSTASAHPELTLTISGHPRSAEIADAVRAAARADDRIYADLRYLSEDDFSAAVSAASLVVLPYRHLHNSGAVLAALSLDRPVLVPDNEITRALAAEVGDGWVHRFAGDLEGSHLVDAELAARTRRKVPDLSRREWAPSAEAHAAAYRMALARGAGRRRRPR